MFHVLTKLYHEMTFLKVVAKKSDAPKMLQWIGLDGRLSTRDFTIFFRPALISMHKQQSSNCVTFNYATPRSAVHVVVQHVLCHIAGEINDDKEDVRNLLEEFQPAAG